MTTDEAVTKIKVVKPRWKRSRIKITETFWWSAQWHILIKFAYSGKGYEYRENPSEAWIEPA